MYLVMITKKNKEIEKKIKLSNRDKKGFSSLIDSEMPEKSTAINTVIAPNPIRSRIRKRRAVVKMITNIADSTHNAINVIVSGLKK